MIDLDENNAPELVGLGDFQSMAGGTVHTAIASSNGAFGTPTTYTGLSASRSAVADLDNDGHQDLVVLGASVGNGLP